MRVAGERASSRCWVLRPDGPGADSKGKDRSTLSTTDMWISSAAGSEARGGQAGGWALACSLRSSSAVSVFSAHGCYPMRQYNSLPNHLDGQTLSTCLNIAGSYPLRSKSKMPSTKSRH